MCRGRWQPYRYDIVLRIVTHEFGHVLGYSDDYENQASVMYYSMVPSYAMDFQENDILDDGGARFYPLCTRKSTATYLIEITSNEEFDVYVVPSRTDWELFTQGKSFMHYSECRAREVASYIRTCEVSTGAGIILRNPTTFGLGPSATFTIVASELL